ncbi:hypothetical protein C7T35_40105 [Variovorax sp. WS11]|uniref:DUF5372 family protein n=1 Tax=Variovorax sp. WS11 TaxID=1105204 RepID=UPI000D0CEF1F|nr:DUF5372 family protein [Variovorax sp. WS11]NDZ13879.1 hypothetical protein [Variovorax sp. WS11]NDZ17166.1 hypothetical protein [Variovorax sp. WS11]NDZ17617.1 hypothetical protein [Variovorax sp. WS11]NDZ18101.1 hypothetical protein [Variovorax sp. WS11]PSL78970.1 hypothetical protein C7T35_40105 [Variovorax sp. WS11]
MGWAEIRHPFHPRRGQRFAVLKARYVAGVDTLILRDDGERLSFAIAREWTDLAAPNPSQRVDGSTARLDLGSLCDLVALLEILAARSCGGLVK